MSKIKYILLILLFPVIINASCDYKKLDEHIKLSNDITYEVNYLKDSEKFEVKIVNLYDGLYIKYDNKIYTGDFNNEVIISNVNQGTNMTMTINSDAEDCDTFIKSFNIRIEYYNEYYDSTVCDKYKEILTVCSKKFLPYKINQYLFDNIVNNYESDNIVDDKKETKKIEIEKTNLYDEVQNFFLEWGFVIILMILSLLIATTIFRKKYRKIKHGI